MSLWRRDAPLQRLGFASAEHWGSEDAPSSRNLGHRRFRSADHRLGAYFRGYLRAVLTGSAIGERRLAKGAGLLRLLPAGLETSQLRVAINRPFFAAISRTVARTTHTYENQSRVTEITMPSPLAGIFRRCLVIGGCFCSFGWGTFYDQAGGRFCRQCWDHESVFDRRRGSLDLHRSGIRLRNKRCRGICSGRAHLRPVPEERASGIAHPVVGPVTGHVAFRVSLGVT
jgi:hypothetical protein